MRCILNSILFKSLINNLSLILLITFCFQTIAAAAPEESPTVPTIEDQKTAAIKKEEARGYFVVSLAAVYSTYLHGIHNEEDDGKIYPFSTLLEIGANDNIGFETGIIFVERQYQVENAAYSLQQNIHRFHIPVTVKIWWRDFVAISAGTYVAIAASGAESYKIIHTSDNGSLKTPAEDFVEFGFETALTLNIPVAEKTGFFIETRYFAPYYSVEFKKINSIYALAGLKYEW